MKNEIRAKKYITLISNHLTELGYEPQLKGGASKYVTIGECNIRISNHIGFSPKDTSIVVSNYSSDIVIVINNQTNIYHSIKEVKNFLTDLVFYQEAAELAKATKDKRIKELTKEIATLKASKGITLPTDIITKTEGYIIINTNALSENGKSKLGNIIAKSVKPTLNKYKNEK